MWLHRYVYLPCSFWLAAFFRPYAMPCGLSMLQYILDSQEQVKAKQLLVLCVLAIACRYFAPAMQKPRGTLLKSFRNALGPQFGSLCLASWLLNLLNMLKSMAENARTENRNNIFVQLLVSCFEFLLTVRHITCVVSLSQQNVCKSAHLAM